MLRRSTQYIVLHCSATSPRLEIGANEIRQWHRAKGWRDIGYHFVIRRDGQVEEGRPLADVGSHVRNHNAHSLGLCLVGGVDGRQRPQDNFTAAQWAALKSLLTVLQSRYPQALIIGHRDFPGVAKACPCFAATDWAKANGFRAAPPLRILTAAMLRAIRQETEDGDEADDVTGAEATEPGKWLTAILGSGGVGSIAGLGYGMDWLGIFIFMLCLSFITCIVLYTIGYERREKLWDRLVG